SARLIEFRRLPMPAQIERHDAPPRPHQHRDPAAALPILLNARRKAVHQHDRVALALILIRNRRTADLERLHLTYSSATTSAVIPRAIPRSPMTVRLAPSFVKYSTSASECARAKILSNGFCARACSRICPASNACGIVISNVRAPGRLAAFSTAGSAA